MDTRKNKHLILDQTKLKKAQQVLGAKTETEAIERALERVISEAEKDGRHGLHTNAFSKLPCVRVLPSAMSLGARRTNDVSRILFDTSVYVFAVRQGHNTLTLSFPFGTIKDGVF